MNRFFKIFIALILFVNCADQKYLLTGSWIQPIPGQADKFQGIKLLDNGGASTINMKTLQYKSWSVRGNKLILEGQSLGNRQTISFTDTLIITQVAPDTLILKKGTLDMVFFRQAD